MAGARSFPDRNSMKASLLFYFEKTWRREDSRSRLPSCISRRTK